MADTLDIQAIRAMAEAATEGPWMAAVGGGTQVMRVWTDKQHWRHTQFLTEIYCSAPGTEDQKQEATATATFIAAARTIVPALCDEVEKLRAELAIARAELGEEHHAHSQFGVGA